MNDELKSRLFSVHHSAFIIHRSYFPRLGVCSGAAELAISAEPCIIPPSSPFAILVIERRDACVKSECVSLVFVFVCDAGEAGRARFVSKQGGSYGKESLRER